jgi:voltage-gated potassium channel
VATRKVYFGILALVVIILGATFGYEAAGNSFLDSLYMVIVTIFGVGYSEMVPVDTPLMKLFTMGVIFAGSCAVVYIIGGFVRVITEGQILQTLGRMKEKHNIEDTEDHAIVCGFGRIGQVLCQELTEAGFPFIVVDINPERIDEAHEWGYLCVRGSATEEDTLVEAGVERARFLATVLPQDTLNVFITLTARNLNTNLRIMARGEQPSTEKKLRQAGADEVVLPAAIGGHRIANSILRPKVMEVIGDSKGLVGTELQQLGLEVDQMTLEHDARLEGMTVADIQQQLKNAMLILALKRNDGRVFRTSIAEHVMEEGDALIVMGRSKDIAELLQGGLSKTELL